MALPIWRDEYISLGTGASTTFRISIAFGDDDRIVYNGVAKRLPSETEARIKINDIASDYLSNILPTLSQAEFNEIDLPLHMKVEKKVTGSTWEEVAELEFYNDWSYDPNFNPATMGLAFPINGKIDARQWLIYTAYEQDSIVANLHFKDGSVNQVIIPISRENDFNDDYNDDFSRSIKSAGSGSVAIDLSQWENLVKVVIENTEYIVDAGCHKYVLHYLNAFGGWDSLIIEGNTTETDEIERKERMVNYDNSVMTNRSRRNYRNNITKGYRLHTGWMNDFQSEMMHHVINSTDVYLENLENGTFFPVVITDTSLEYKTFRTQNGLVNYEINVQVAQERTRR